jgi:translin
MKSEPTGEPSLEEIVARLRAILEATNRAREEALRASREVIQFSSRTIRAVHRGEMEAAQALADEAQERVEAVKRLLHDHPDLYFAG